MIFRGLKRMFCRKPRKKIVRKKIRVELDKGIVIECFESVYHKRVLRYDLPDILFQYADSPSMFGARTMEEAIDKIFEGRVQLEEKVVKLDELTATRWWLDENLYPVRPLLRVEERLSTGTSIGGLTVGVPE